VGGWGNLCSREWGLYISQISGGPPGNTGVSTGSFSDAALGSDVAALVALGASSSPSMAEVLLPSYTTWYSLDLFALGM
jgi:hypothetical protein